MVEFLDKAGPLIYPLALCSILAGTIALERMLALRRSRVLPKEIVEVVEAVQPENDPAVAVEVCRRNPGVFSDIMRVGLEQADAPWEVMRDAVLDVGRQETTRLERHLVWLQTIAQAAPLLGLLGTVLGMIKVFSSISLAGLGDPQALSEGISEAMITTAVGLAVGIPTLVAYNLLAAKAEALITEIEAYASALVARLRGRNGNAPS
ncbi:MAG: MotA/TolQ/ExbB proton channel family protein [Candidatus Eisenbacteria bacterium]|uniref:MotA/TolQ/ExbB proton channel family protein n=1 Tax=Eiseniibacteriota bacterium TaxID=2212470 RepID=A0A7Y2E9I8_UNCEI|nr:MotA/TolQ/ExbB proton channel family protein [Candidatus Eisenbacteria bacterium]